MKMKLLAVSGALLAALAFSPVASALDAAGAEALAKKEGCLKCHGIDKKKEADSLISISAKLKKLSDAKILEHLTTGPKVKMADGSEEEHKILKTKDKGDIDNLIAWLRSLAK
ncbi:c-type cytochrome [Uliginosibacterium sp. TH139]|uniref:c-type cytochrome n=1 Tax=Uliginosibacterium sp. TH139 TaxID=2067453 RepID=UPI000C79CBF3|nr:c-type cytochrome [Uliginosibacterium sp. TH139]PLK50498.1 class I cytochrome c [Uliginosibacterium sp. TH139]